MIRRNINGRRVEHHGFGETLLFWDAGQTLQLLGVDDRQIEPDLRALVEECEGDDLARSRWESEGNVESPEDDFDVRDLLLDEPD